MSPRLQLRVAQKQILSPGLVQMVSMLQMTRLELKDLINQEIAENPVLEEAVEGEEITPQELQTLLEAERLGTPADEGLLQLSESHSEIARKEESAEDYSESPIAAAAEADAVLEPAQPTDPFDEIDFGSFFDDYLDPGYKSPAAEASEKPSFEMFLSAPETLADHLESQLSLVIMGEAAREAAFSIIGNLDENGYLSGDILEIAEAANCRWRMWKRR